MDFLSDFWSDFAPQLIIGIPVLLRLTALAFTLPLISSSYVPVRLRAGFGVVLTILVAPVLAARAGSTPTEADLAWGLSLIHETLIGASMGLAAQVLLAAARIAGSSIESLAGLTFGLPAESENLEDGSAFSKLYWWTTVAVFIATGGATAMVGGIIESFRVWPPGASSFGRDTLDFFTAALRNCFDFGLRAALPGMAALLVASAVLGIAQRNCPQLGGIQVGLGLKAIAGLLVTSLLLLSTPWIVSHGFEESWGQLQELFTACEASP